MGVGLDEPVPFIAPPRSLTTTLAPWAASRQVLPPDAVAGTGDDADPSLTELGHGRRSYGLRSAAEERAPCSTIGHLAPAREHPPPSAPLGLIAALAPLAIVSLLAAWGIDTATGGDVVRNVELAGRPVGGDERTELDGTISRPTPTSWRPRRCGW